jgi:hypothetical protein
MRDDAAIFMQIERRQIVEVSQRVGRAAALVGSLVLAGILVSCEGGSPGGDIIPGSDPAAPLAIVFPSTGMHVGGEVLELTSVGMRHVAAVSVSVYTDRLYPQTGKLRTSDNHSWAYAPVYLSGQGSFNNHRIEVVLDHTDGSREVTSVDQVV